MPEDIDPAVAAERWRCHQILLLARVASPRPSGVANDYLAQAERAIESGEALETFTARLPRSVQRGFGGV